MTAKRDGLWEPMGDVTAEDIGHMKARVEIFPATHVVGTCPDEFQTSPACPNPWCRWLVTDSIAYAARQGPRTLGLSAEMRARIEANRQAAKKRRLEREQQEALELMEAAGQENQEEFPDFEAEGVLWEPMSMDESG